MRDRPRMVGRDREREGLARFLGGAATGPGAVGLVSGEAGVGKTRLISEVLAESGKRILAGAASPGDPSPYGPLVQILRAHLRIAGSDLRLPRPLTRHLATLLPELGPRPRDEGDRGTLFEAARLAFSSIASRAPSVVLLDDLHHADAGTVDLLLFLNDVTVPGGLPFLGAYRNDQVPRGHPIRRLRTELRRRGRMWELSLEPLSPEEGREMVAQILGDTPSPALAAGLYERSVGVPFFLGELTKALSEGAFLRSGPAGLEMTPGVVAPVPESIQDAVLLRMEGLTSASRRVLEEASVIGTRFDPALLGVMTEDDAPLVEASETFCRVHAHRDAVRAARQALELWPEDEDAGTRLALLERLGHCAELSGDLGQAARAWSRVAEERQRTGNLYEFANLQRRLATVWSLQGAGDRAIAAHRAGADALALHGLPGEAAFQRLVAAKQLEVRGNRRTALALALRATVEAGEAERVDLQALAMGMEGLLRVELGQEEAGLHKLGSGLGLALSWKMGGPVTELLLRVASALMQAGRYTSCPAALEAGIDYCREHGFIQSEGRCLASYAAILLELGEWDRATRLCRDLLREPDERPFVRAAATCVSGLVLALRGLPGPARKGLLAASLAGEESPRALALELSALWGMAVADELDGDHGSAVERVRTIRERWAGADEDSTVVHPLRWASSFLAENGLESDVRACAEVLASVATKKGSGEALAAFAHALGECALLERAPDRALGHFERARELLTGTGLSFQHVHTQLRAAAALTAIGDRAAATDRFVDVYRMARRLGARPLAMRAVEGLRELGEPLERRLGRRAVGEVDRAGLTRRELQVLCLVDRGRSNREIARELFLSPRTVEMHVGNALSKLGCARRAEAAHRARSLGVIG